MYSDTSQRVDHRSERIVIAHISGEHDVRDALSRPGNRLQSEMMPGNIVPRHQARRIPKPSVAVSDEVMPPFARTKAGLTWLTISRTVPTSAALTVRAITRLSTASLPVTSVRLVRITMSLSASLLCSALAACPAMSLTCCSRALSSSKSGHRAPVR